MGEGGSAFEGGVLAQGQCCWPPSWLGLKKGSSLRLLPFSSSPPPFPSLLSPPLPPPRVTAFIISGAYCGGRPVPGLNLYYLLVLAATRRVGLKASWMGRYTANWKLQ